MNVLLADDHVIVRLGIEILIEDALGSNVKIYQASNGKEIVDLLKTESIDMLISDINMPETDSFANIKEALRLNPQLKIVMLSVNPETVFAKRYLKAGAHAYLQKSISDKEFIKAIKTVASGKKYMSEVQHNILLNMLMADSKQLDDNNPFDYLSSREFEVAMLLLKGYGSIEISNALAINASTTSTYKSRVYEKLGISSVVELAKLAVHYDIIAEQG
ncbi:response regulator [Polluticaenibacter yanchengensis]|uniref:Response regulator transcription factor n=1 Tax=Polluticaenibacter yanchengensis TaxID=3014562 RepID=A0ABT4UNM4_9BACT|nr:response regulator transcription factor [Chitinophagaceae bacterium LY-5]